MSAFGSGPSNGQFWYGSTTNFPGFLYKKNVGVGGRLSTKMGPGGNVTCNSSTYIYNKYKPGQGGVGASSIANRRAKNRHATVCTEQKCFPCYMTLGQYSNYTHNPNGFIPCPAIPARRPQPPISNFLVYQEGTRGPGSGILDTNFGWDTNGVWFTGEAGNPNPAYPIFTNFNISQNKKVVVMIDFVYNEYESDFGLCFYQSNIIPQWQWTVNSTRIACQYNYDTYSQILGLVPGNIFTNNIQLSVGNTYTTVVTYEPDSLSLNANITFQTYLGSTHVDTNSGTITKLSSDYKIGFTADQDTPHIRTYIKNLTINVNNGEQIYNNSLINPIIPHV
jgi:hypothetical protein